MNQNASISVKVAASDYETINRQADLLAADNVDVISAALEAFTTRFQPGPPQAPRPGQSPAQPPRRASSGGPTMRAISLWQPWASLIAIGAKLIETRSWYTPYRGPLVIHASAALHPQCREAFRDKTIRRMLETYGCTAARIEDLPRKALLAVCELRAVDYTKAVQFVVDAKPQSWYRQSANSLAGLYNATLGQRALGNFEPGRYAWFLSDVQPLRQPIRYAGQRSFFQVPDTILSHLEQKGCVNG